MHVIVELYFIPQLKKVKKNIIIMLEIIYLPVKTIHGILTPLRKKSNT